MKRLLALAIVLALGAGGAHAKEAYCKDPTTHKRISCKAAAATPAAAVPMAAAPAASAKKSYCQDPTSHKRISCKAVGGASLAVTPTPAMAATPIGAVPAKRPSMFSGMMKPKPATAPTQSPAPTSSSSMTATGGAPHCTKGKVCGHSCIAMDKICHKP